MYLYISALKCKFRDYVWFFFTICKRNIGVETNYIYMYVYIYIYVQTQYLTRLFTVNF